MLNGTEKIAWTTPRHLFEKWNREFSFSVDAAASEDNRLLPRFWMKENNALCQDWTRYRLLGRRCI